MVHTVVLFLLQTVVVFAEAMQRACTDVAYKVGDNWPIVYLKLPFMPPRTPQKRQEDIRGMFGM